MELKEELKNLIIETLDLDEITPDDIVDDEPLFIDGLGLDSIDALELGMALKKNIILLWITAKKKIKGISLL